MRYISVCSGIEAASVAWKPLGWECAAMSEIAAFPRSVLKHHYPDVPLRGDFTEIEADDHGAIDILVGGTPCQSFSISGLRNGLADKRGNLALEFLRLAARKKPSWIVWENVPGVLSSKKGQDFGCILGGLAECGYGFAYRILDAQFIRVQSHAFAVPQRRRRVFVVGYLGDWRRAAQVLFEFQSLQGSSPPRRIAGKIAANSLGTGFGSRGGPSGMIDAAQGNHLIPTRDVVGPLVAGSTSNGHGRSGVNSQAAFSGHIIAVKNETTDVSHCLNAGGVYCNGEITAPLTTQRDESANVVAYGFEPRSRGDDGRGYDRAPHFSEEVAATVNSTKPGAVAFSFDKTQITNPNNRSQPSPCKPCHTLSSHGHPPAVVYNGVRRLTPLECERLQGFPDGYTDVIHRKKPASDSPRYMALGNSMAINVMSWLGQRIQMVKDRIQNDKQSADT